MYRFVCVPKGFYWYGVAFDAISVIITLLIALYALKLYKFSGDKGHKYFSISFFLITISFIFKSLSNLVETSEAVVGQIAWSITVPELATHPPFFIGTYLAYRLFMLIGFLGIYSILYKIRGSGIWVALYLTLIVTIFSTATYLIFYTTTAVFLFWITRYYYNNYKRLRTAKSQMVLSAFAFIMVGQIIFLGISYKMHSYIIGETLQLLGYLLLLSSYIGLVVKNGKADKT